MIVTLSLLVAILLCVSNSLTLLYANTELFVAQVGWNVATAFLISRPTVMRIGGGVFMIFASISLLPAAVLQAAAFSSLDAPLVPQFSTVGELIERSIRNLWLNGGYLAAAIALVAVALVAQKHSVRQAHKRPISPTADTTPPAG